jgi:hypothetical protein
VDSVLLNSPGASPEGPHGGAVRVTVGSQARADLQAIVAAHQLLAQGGKQDAGFLRFYGRASEDASPLLACIHEVLHADPRSVHTKTKFSDVSVLAVRIDGIDIAYSVRSCSDTQETVVDVEVLEVSMCAELKDKLPQNLPVSPSPIRTAEWVKYMCSKYKLPLPR